MNATSERELVALEFKTPEGLLYCLDLLEKERSDVPFSLPGKQSVIIPKDESRWFEEKIKENGHAFSETRVVPASAVPRDRLAQLRAQQFGSGKPSRGEYGDLSWKKARIEELRKKLGR